MKPVETKPTKLFIQGQTKMTKEQLALYQEWTKDMEEDCKLFFTHVLNCHRQEMVWGDHDEVKWPGVPVPRKSFIHRFCRDYKWDQVEHVLTRTPYDKEEGVCYRYQLQLRLYDQFIKAGESYLMNFNSFKEDHLYDNDGNRLNKLIKPFSSSPSTQIDLSQAIHWLTTEKEWLKNNRGKEDANRRYRRYIHNLNCYQAMLERLTAVDYEKRIAWYSQELKQPHADLRFYEVGGGMQNASRGFRACLLATSPLVNIDAVKCHTTIAHNEMERLGIKSHLEKVIANNLEIPGCRLTKKTIKTAYNAILNGAKITNRLTRRYTIPKLVLDDPNMKGQPEAVLKGNLLALNNEVKKTAQAVKAWAETLPEAPVDEFGQSIQKVSAYLQRCEVKTLAPLKKIQCNDQHDGALVYINDTPPEIWQKEGWILGDVKLVAKPVNDGGVKEGEAEPSEELAYYTGNIWGWTKRKAVETAEALSIALKDTDLDRQTVEEEAHARFKSR